MVYDIKGLNSRQTNGASERSTTPVSADTRAAQTDRAGSTPTEDSVEWSGLAEVIKATAAALATESAVDQARVREIRNAVANGGYQINPERIARKLIESDSL